MTVFGTRHNSILSQRNHVGTSQVARRCAHSVLSTSGEQEKKEMWTQRVQVSAVSRTCLDCILAKSKKEKECTSFGEQNKYTCKTCSTHRARLIMQLGVLHDSCISPNMMFFFYTPREGAKATKQAPLSQDGLKYYVHGDPEEAIFVPLFPQFPPRNGLSEEGAEDQSERETLHNLFDIWSIYNCPHSHSFAVF